MELTIDNKLVNFKSKDELLKSLNKIEQKYAEIWLSAENSFPSICLLKNGNKAMLMFLRYEGDTGFTSRGNFPAKPSVEFHLSNGQVDKHPGDWIISYEDAKKAIIHTFETQKKASFIKWHEF